MHEQVEDSEYPNHLKNNSWEQGGSWMCVHVVGEGLEILNTPGTHEGRQRFAAALLYHSSLTRRSGTLWPTPPVNPSGQVHAASGWFKHGEI